MEWEVPMLLDMGMEVYVPKLLPVGPNSRTATVTDEYDASLTIPKQDLEYLNTVNFYEDPITARTARIINRHFENCISAYIFPGLYYLLRAFKGRIFMRAFGHAGTFDYEHATATVDMAKLDENSYCSSPKRQLRRFGKVLNRKLNPAKIKHHNPVMDEMFACRNRVYLAAAYKEIIDNELDFLKPRSLYLPLALPKSILNTADTWRGGDRRVLFVCPNIDQIDYYRRIYVTFKDELGHLPYCIAGRQDLGGVDTPLTTQDPGILGYVSRGELDALMRSCSCMFYHSREERHLHYHPLEAIVVGLPLIFMSGGLLEACGGSDQPGMCANYDEARLKIARLQNGDENFRSEICAAQKRILEPFDADSCAAIWKESFAPLALGKAA